ncbi:hypothetical protein FFI16_004280 [Pseudomonas sp. KBS0710]|uniref:hypothetical protein n=1 Tax=Pseudomonas sp. KBS0710 TaxID=1179667 RepID=UPI00110D9B3A|nr:hypothetical protein [Pseudomonas sp. KBS0710]TSD75666.1 hypothetical protein FFI16_004280 [Pseudomonas sp. KBS0710]
MSFEGIVEIFTTDLDEAVNAYLKDGWELLAINPGKEYPMYSVGRRGTKKGKLKISSEALKKASRKS